MQSSCAKNEGECAGAARGGEEGRLDNDAVEACRLAGQFLAVMLSCMSNIRPHRVVEKYQRLVLIR